MIEIHQNSNLRTFLTSEEAGAVRRSELREALAARSETGDRYSARALDRLDRHPGETLHEILSGAMDRVLRRQMLTEMLGVAGLAAGLVMACCGPVGLGLSLAASSGVASLLASRHQEKKMWSERETLFQAGDLVLREADQRSPGRLACVSVPPGQLETQARKSIAYGVSFLEAGVEVDSDRVVAVLAHGSGELQSRLDGSRALLPVRSADDLHALTALECNGGTSELVEPQLGLALRDLERWGFRFRNPEGDSLGSYAVYKAFTDPACASLREMTLEFRDASGPLTLHPLELWRFYVENPLGRKEREGHQFFDAAWDRRLAVGPQAPRFYFDGRSYGIASIDA